MKGFTLIELLVVISIVGILATFGFASYGQMQKDARDTRRKADLKQIQSAMEQYRALCGAYPTIQPNSFPDSIFCTSPSIMVLTPVPHDPDGSEYRCVTNCDTTEYTIAPVDYETGEDFQITNQQ